MSEESKTRQKVKKALKFFMILSVLAWPITLYLAYNHFNPTGSKVCNFNDYVSCDVVNLSPQSEIFGLPVSVLGFLTYLTLFLLAFGVYQGWNFKKVHKSLREGNVLKIITAITTIGLLFSLYLTYVELFILKALCPFCITQQVIILIMFFTMLYIHSAISDNKKKNEVCEFC